MSYIDYLFDSVGYNYNKPLFIDASDPTRSLSAAEVKTMVSKVVAGLRHHGLKKGDAVCVMGFNDILYTPLYLGIMAAGGIFTGVNPAYKLFELGHQLRLCHAKFLVASPGCLEVAMDAAKEVCMGADRIFVFNHSEKDVPAGCKVKSWWTLTEHGEGEWEVVHDPANEPACYINSSGTSGLPKAVVVPHMYLQNQVEILVTRKLPYKVFRLICIPPFSGYNVPSQHGAPIKAGNPVYVLPRYEIKSFLAAVKKYQATETLLLPPILLALPNSKEIKSDPDALKSLRQIFCGGAAIGSGVQSRFYKILHPAARVAQVFGQTECGWVMASMYPEKDETGSVGRPLKTYQVKVVDDDEVEITEPDMNGEIFIKPTYPMLGYYNNETASKAAFAAGGWIKTGDVGHFDKDGLYYITDRKKDLIKIRGWQVSPAELEEVLLMHPDILDAAIIGHKMPSPSTEEVPHAYVVLHEGSSLTTQDVQDFMAVRLARYKVAEQVFFIESLPRNPTGKIVRRMLKPTYEESVRERVNESGHLTVTNTFHGNGIGTQIVMTPGSATPATGFSGSFEGSAIARLTDCSADLSAAVTLLADHLNKQVLGTRRSPPKCDEPKKDAGDSFTSVESKDDAVSSSSSFTTNATSFTSSTKAFTVPLIKITGVGLVGVEANVADTDMKDEEENFHPVEEQA